MTPEEMHGLMSTAGMLAQGGPGGHLVPLAARFYRTLVRFPLHLHGIQWKLHIVGPPG